MTKAYAVLAPIGHILGAVPFEVHDNVTTNWDFLRSAERVPQLEHNGNNQAIIAGEWNPRDHRVFPIPHPPRHYALFCGFQRVCAPCLLGNTRNRPPRAIAHQIEARFGSDK